MPFKATAARSLRFAATANRITALVLFALSFALVLPGIPLAAEDAKTFVTLTVNAQDAGETLVLLRGPDVLMKAADLAKSGINAGTIQTETIDGDRYVSLSALRDIVTFAFDADATTLTLTAVPKALESHVVDLSAHPERVPVDVANRSAYLTYAVTGEADAPLSGSVQAGAHAFGAFVSTGGTLEAGRRYVPSLTSVSFDNDPALRRVTVGDAAVDTGDIGGAPVISGITVARNFSLDPAAVTFGRPAVRGEALYPSTADVYVNGVLVKSVHLPAGSYDLRNVPILTGANDAHVVVRDAFGHQQVVDQGFYASASLLQRGTTDYSYSLGSLRTTDDDETPKLGSAAIAGRYRFGVSDDATLGARIESSPGLVSGGGNLDVRLPRGVAHFALGASRDGTARGEAAAFTYELTGRHLYFTGALRAQSTQYANLTLGSQDERATTDLTVRTGMPTSAHADISVGYSARTYRYAGFTSELTLQHTFAVRSDVNAVTTLTRASASGGRRLQISAALNIVTGSRSSASLTTATGPGSGGSSLQLKRFAPAGEGIGYQTTISPLAASPLAGTLDAHGALADAHVEYSAAANGIAANATISGSVVAIGNQIRFSRPIDQGYALVQVPGERNVHVFVENQDIGRTDRSGSLLLPSLLPYYANHVSIADLDTPLGTSVASVDRLVAPVDHGGSVVRFAVHKIAAFVGRIGVSERGKHASAAYGEMLLGVSGAAGRSDIAEDGSFYFENLAPGSYPARVHYAGGWCAFTLAIPSAMGVRTDLGTLTCAG